MAAAPIVDIDKVSFGYDAERPVLAEYFQRCFDLELDESHARQPPPR